MVVKIILSVQNLSKAYGSHTVVDDISFEVTAGEIFGILGPNGAGKTTTLEMIETLRPIDSGQIKLDEIDVAKHPQTIRTLIGVQLQASAFMDKVKLTELLEMTSAAYGEKVNPQEFLDEVSLEDKGGSYFEDLSGGQKQRFSLAAALVHNPKVFFMDEPTTGLDPQARHNLWKLIRRIRNKGITVILTTHYLEEAELLCHRVAIMDNGRIIALDTPNDLIKQLLARGFKKTQHVEPASLEDVFINLTGKELRD
jgi:ABC-2 type transport system ATP-binding protein